MITMVLSNFLSYCFAKRWNLSWGIPDIVFLFSTDAVFGTVRMLLYNLPVMAFFGKVIPARIEGTTFAFLTGTMNLGSTVISPGIGTFINYEWVHVNKHDLSNYSTLMLIALVGSILSFVLLPLIPTKKNVKTWRAKRAVEE